MRGIDFSYKTNILIVVIFVILFFTKGFSIGVSVFLSWAIAREIDYKNDWSAFLGLPVGYYLIVNYRPASNLALITILLFLRLFSKTGKINPTILDYSLVSFMVLYVYYFGMIFETGNLYILGATFLGVYTYRILVKMFK